MQGIPIIVGVVNLRKPKGEVLVNYRLAIYLGPNHRLWKPSTASNSQYSSPFATHFLSTHSISLSKKALPSPARWPRLKLLAGMMLFLGLHSKQSSRRIVAFSGANERSISSGIP